MAEEMFGPYRIEALIGRGGMGEVHRAVDTVHDRVVAIKRLPAALASDPEFQARFRAESALAARLNEPHIIPIHDYGEIDGRLYIDMRLVEGEDLAALLARGGALSPSRAVDIVVQVAAALDAAHAEALVHRDIKPANVLVTGGSDGTGEFVYVADFGIARAVSAAATSLTATGTTVGSLDYMAPERFTGGHGDHRVDVYSLGCLLFEALTARRPFVGEGAPAMIYSHLHAPVPSPSELVADVPAELDAVVARAMAKDPADRFPTAGALAAAARSAVGSAPAAGMATPGPTTVATGPVAVAGRVGPVGGAPPPARVRLRPALLVGSAVALVLVVLGGAALAIGPGALLAQIRTDPIGEPGDNPFMPSVGTDRPGVTSPAPTGGPRGGGASGLYGGRLNEMSCDPDAMVEFLRANPDKGAAWAQVLGIAPGQVPTYVARLTPVILRSDTAVTNHGFLDGRATVVPAVLQAGTAVLIDEYGVPRARCSCGNPLTPAARVGGANYLGRTWPGFSPAAVTTVLPAAATIAEFTIVDPATDEVIMRPSGSRGERDRPVAPPPPTATPPPSVTAPPSTDSPIPPATTTQVPATAPGTSIATPADTSVPTSRPDLEPTSIEFDRAALTTGSEVLFESGLTNAGPVSTRDFSVKWFVDGREVGAYGGHAGVAANTTVLTGNSFFKWTFNEPGSYRITFTVDADNHVAESDEADNSRSVTVDIAGQVPDAGSAPVITSVSSYKEGVLVYLSLRFTDADGDANGFALDWLTAPNHQPVAYTFASPSYGRVSAGRVDYPFNHDCGGPNEYESEVKAWIIDKEGRYSAPVVVHLTCG